MNLLSQVDPPNQTFTYILTMASFDIPSPVNYLVFAVGVLVYMFSFFGNLTILVLIITQKSLHKPMFYILFSLPLNDIIGITAFLPRLLHDIVTQTNLAYYPTCVLQAFWLHMYGGAVLFILAAMSIDRYIAICKPLQYHSLMTPFTMCSLITLAWGFDFVLMLILFGLQARAKNRCRNTMQNVYCENVSLLLLSCGDDLTVNNIYGVAMTAFFQIVSLVIQLFSYANILVVCVMNRHSDTISKAVNTCLSQIVTFVIFEFLATFTVAAYRSQTLSPNARKLSGMLIWILLPVFNPIIYGIKTKDIRAVLVTLLKKDNKIAL
ncbi:olfactory receptor 5AR1-like [Osmerus eperlanus]|uniref:olfactory receptor 5AR1-like n=1 Tax=Osmerus eperlanus TaxID=29151 RepID=UPI002E152275